VNYKNTNWNQWTVDYLSTFNTSVPIFSPSVYREYRGEIFTTFHNTYHPVIDLLGMTTKIHSRFSKSYKGVLRGLHYDFETSKLVQSLVGDIYLVVLDMRKEYPTYGKWESYVLSEKTRQQIFIPPGFANGHYALTDCIFHYDLFYEDEYVDENAQKVVKWNDARFNIEWPTENPVLQKRDR
jgi:dTDP-4-dehydrorhamnose 3,5-epimerase